MTTRNIETIPATEVRNGDIIFTNGYRCRANDCQDFTTDGIVTRRFTLTSEPDAINTDRLPVGYEGGNYGGNSRARFSRENA